MPDHTRDPCPFRIVNDFGGAFAMGAVGGTLWHGIKGIRNSPKGERLPGAIVAIKARAPVLAGSFAVWGGLISAFDCAFAGIRRKEDAWNVVAAGAATGGVLAIRGGWQATLASALMGGILIGVMEGANMGIMRLMADSSRPVAPVIEPVAPLKMAS